MIENEIRGTIYKSTTNVGIPELRYRGYVEYGKIIDHLSDFDIGERRINRIKKVITSGSDQVWNIMLNGGALTMRGRIVSLGEGNESLINSFFNENSPMVMTTTSGAKFEQAKEQFGGSESFLVPSEKVIVLKKGANQELGFAIYKSGACNLRFTCLNDNPDNTVYAGDASLLTDAIANRFNQLFEQSGIPKAGLIRPQTLSSSLLLNIAHHSGKSVTSDLRVKN